MERNDRLPDGVTDADIDRAFGDPEAWRRSTCGDCRYLTDVEWRDGTYFCSVCMSDRLAPVVAFDTNPACEEYEPW